MTKNQKICKKKKQEAGNKDKKMNIKSGANSEDNLQSLSVILKIIYKDRFTKLIKLKVQQIFKLKTVCDFADSSNNINT